MNWLPLYDVLKVLHIISAMFLFGFGLGTAWYMLRAKQSGNMNIMAMAFKQVVFADWCFTGASGVIQILTGLGMVGIKGYLLNLTAYQLHNLWVYGSIIGYGIAALCWFPVVWLQIKLARMARTCVLQQSSPPPQFERYYRTWLTLGYPAFISLVMVYYLMSNRPL